MCITIPPSAWISPFSAAGEIIERLDFLIEAEELDIIFFVGSGGHAATDLLVDVARSLDIFQTKIKLVIPHGTSHGLRPRLNSGLFLYETHEDSFTLFESYGIR